MVKMLMILSITMSFLFTLIKHPLSMGLILLIQTTLIAMITGLLSHNFWFSYILFMIMIGGMLVLFIYMTSVASNEKFNYSNKLMMVIMLSMLMMSAMLFSDNLPSNLMTTNTDLWELSTNPMFKMSLSKYLNIPSNMLMIMMIIYLLMALIAVVKITNITYGPLRQKL